MVVIFLGISAEKSCFKEEMFIDLVDVKVPNLKRVLKEVTKSSIVFFKKIISTCLVISFALAILTTITVKIELAQTLQDSLACFLCKKTAFILRPLGLGDWRIFLALFMGAFAKEGMVATLLFLFPEGIALKISGAIVLLFVVFCYTPCLTHLAVLNKEKKHLGTYVFLKHNIIAYVGGFLINMLLTNLNIFCIITIIIIGIFVFYERIYKSRKRKAVVSGR